MERKSTITKQSGLASIEEAKQVARRLYDQYDPDGYGYIGNLGICSMISDAYNTFNKEYQPNKSDIDAYTTNINQNNQGRISYQDLENACIKYLCK